MLFPSSFSHCATWDTLRWDEHELIPSAKIKQHPLETTVNVGNFHITGTIYRVFNIRGMGLLNCHWLRTCRPFLHPTSSLLGQSQGISYCFGGHATSRTNRVIRWSLPIFDTLQKKPQLVRRYSHWLHEIKGLNYLSKYGGVMANGVWLSPSNLGQIIEHPMGTLQVKGPIDGFQVALLGPTSA